MIVMATFSGGRNDIFLKCIYKKCVLSDDDDGRRRQNIVKGRQCLEQKEEAVKSKREAEIEREDRQGDLCRIIMVHC